MKSITQVSKETGLNYSKISRVIKANFIQPHKVNGLIFLDQYQEDLLHFSLYNLGILEFVTFESKINLHK